MADGRHFEKSKNSDISSAVRRIVTKIGIGTDIDPLKRVAILWATIQRSTSTRVTLQTAVYDAGFLSPDYVFAVVMHANATARSAMKRVIGLCANNCSASTQMALCPCRWQWQLNGQTSSSYTTQPILTL